MENLTYKWNLATANFTKDKGKVFSCFACGGGSTMGYKLAGFDVIGCNEIDKRVNQVYVKNHNPKYNYLCDIREFVKMAQNNELPAELYNLDILDGSPPCSSFSLAGKRDKDWGKEKYFREGQQKQVLDTLFFDFIELGKILQPKCMIIENVKGLLMTEAKKYVIKIYEELEQAGYYALHFLLNASTMGVPQNRERVFFICFRKDLAGPFLVNVGLFEKNVKFNLEFNEKPILFKEIKTNDTDRKLTGKILQMWKKRIYGDIDLSFPYMREENKCALFSNKFIYDEKVANTLTAKEPCILFSEPRYRNKTEVIMCSSFPLDYDFLNQQPHYICGMSVPPLMIAKISNEVYKQFLSKL